MTNRAEQAGKLAEELMSTAYAALPSEDDEVQDEAVEEVVEEPIPVDNEWEKRYKNYKASTDNTIYELRQRTNQFDVLQQEVEQLRQQNAELAQAKPQDIPEELLTLFSKEEVGSIDQLVDRKVSGLNEEVSRLKAELAAEKAAKQEQQAYQTRQQIINTVASKIDNFDEINNSTGFRDYMQEPDEFGNVRYDLLQRALTASPPDIDRLVRFYTDYVALKTPEVQEKKITQKELLQQPTSTSNDSTEKTGLGIHWTPQLIKDFYTDSAAGRIEPEKAKALEADMRSYLYGG